MALSPPHHSPSTCGPTCPTPDPHSKSHSAPCSSFVAALLPLLFVQKDRDNDTYTLLDSENRMIRGHNNSKVFVPDNVGNSKLFQVYDVDSTNPIWLFKHQDVDVYTSLSTRSSEPKGDQVFNWEDVMHNLFADKLNLTPFCNRTFKTQDPLFIATVCYLQTFAAVELLPRSLEQLSNLRYKDDWMWRAMEIKFQTLDSIAERIAEKKEVKVDDIPKAVQAEFQARGIEQDPDDISRCSEHSKLKRNRNIEEEEEEERCKRVKERVKETS